MKQLLTIISACILFSACNRDHVGPQRVNEQHTTVDTDQKVFLVNEGNFQWGNASISAYNPVEFTLQHQIFSSTNNNIPLGDVAQDLQLYKDRYYVVMNNSGMVRVADTNWQLIGNIEDLQTPRYIAFADDHAFVTELYAKKLWILNLNQMQVEKALDMPTSSFHIANWNSKIVVGLTNQIAIVNPDAQEIDTLITLSRGVERMQEDKNGKLWILCSSGSSGSHLYQLQEDWSVSSHWTFPPNSSTSYLEMNSTKDTLIFVMPDGIYHQAVSANILDPTQIVSLNDQNVYGFSVNPEDGDLYLMDALDFNQASDVYRYSKTGELLHQFKGGVITNAVRFF